MTHIITATIIIIFGAIVTLGTIFLSGPIECLVVGGLLTFAGLVYLTIEICRRGKNEKN